MFKMHDFQLSSWQADNQLVGKSLSHMQTLGYPYKFTLKIFVYLDLYSYQPTSFWPLKSCNNQGCLLLQLDLLFCSIQLQYECQIFILSFSSGIYTESIRSKQKPYSTVDKCAVIIFNNEKIQKIKLNS